MRGHGADDLAASRNHARGHHAILASGGLAARGTRTREAPDQNDHTRRLASAPAASFGQGRGGVRTSRRPRANGCSPDPIACGGHNVIAEPCSGVGTSTRHLPLGTLQRWVWGRVPREVPRRSHTLRRRGCAQPVRPPWGWPGPRCPTLHARPFTTGPSRPGPSRPARVEPRRPPPSAGSLTPPRWPRRERESCHLAPAEPHARPARPSPRGRGRPPLVPGRPRA